VEMIAMGLDGGMIVEYLSAAKPGVLDEIERFSDAEVEVHFADDPVLKIALQLPRWKSVLAEVRAYMAEEEPQEVAARN
jgi:hypothetical protein